MKPLRVLIGCEFSGIVRDAFRALGHDAWSCDLLPTERPGPHIMDDVRNVLDAGWDLMIAHPPCQYLSYVGNRHWNNPGRAEKRETAMQLFMAMIHAPIPRICVENPLGYPGKVYRKPDQIIDPYLFGDPFKKRTCLWLKNLPPLWHWNDPNGLFPVTGVPKPEPLYYLSTTGRPVNWVDGGTRSASERSTTFPGIAAAMAAQWGAGEMVRLEQAS